MRKSSVIIFCLKYNFKKFSKTTIVKLFTNQSEVSFILAGSLFLESYPVSVAQNRSIFHSNHSSFISCSFFPLTFDFIPQQYSILIVMIQNAQLMKRFLCSFGVNFEPLFPFEIGFEFEIKYTDDI